MYTRLSNTMLGHLYMKCKYTQLTSKMSLTSSLIHDFGKDVRTAAIDPSTQRIFYSTGYNIRVDKYIGKHNEKKITTVDCCKKLRIFGDYLYILSEIDTSPLLKIPLSEKECNENNMRDTMRYGTIPIYSAIDFTLDSKGNIYTLSSSHISSICKPHMDVYVVSGDLLSREGYKDGVGEQVIFNKPSCIVCNDDILYIAESSNNAIRIADTRVAPMQVRSITMYFESIAITQGSNINVKLSISFDHVGRMLVGYNNRLTRVDIGKSIMEVLYDFDSDMKIRDIIHVDKDSIYLLIIKSATSVCSIWKLENKWIYTKYIMLVYMEKENPITCAMSILPKDILKVIMKFISS